MNNDSIVIRTDKATTDAQHLAKQLQEFFHGSEFDATLISEEQETMGGHISKINSIKIERKSSNEKTISTK